MEFLHLGCRLVWVGFAICSASVGFPVGVEPVAARGPSIQSVALPGATGADIVELASLGKFGRQPQHIAEHTLKYCKASSYNLPSPYIAEALLWMRMFESLWVALATPMASGQTII